MICILDRSAVHDKNVAPQILTDYINLTVHTMEDHRSLSTSLRCYLPYKGHKVNKDEPGMYTQIYRFSNEKPPNYVIHIPRKLGQLFLDLVQQGKINLSGFNCKITRFDLKYEVEMPCSIEVQNQLHKDFLKKQKKFEKKNQTNREINQLKKIFATTAIGNRKQTIYSRVCGDDTTMYYETENKKKRADKFNELVQTQRWEELEEFKQQEFAD